MEYQAYPDWNPRTPTTARHYNGLIEWIDDLLRDYLSRGLVTTKRGVYYRAGAAGLVKKVQADAVENQIKWALLRGELPWDAFADEGREVNSLPSWPTAESYLTDVLDPTNFRVDPWDDQSVRVVVAIEKAALLAVVEPICLKRRIAYTATKGDAGDIYLRNILFGRYVPRAVESDQDLVILHLSDLNPSGVDASNALQRKLDAFLAVEYPDARAEIRRIALTWEQVLEHGLEELGQDLAKKDKRIDSANYTLAEQWDLDALPPDVLQRLLEDEIRKYIDAAAWAASLGAEKAERDKLHAMRNGDEAGGL